MLPQNIQSLIDASQLDKAVEALSDFIAQHPDNDEALTARGRIYWRMGRRQAATSDYSAAVAANPSSPAAVLLEQAGDIYDFFNPDLLNP